MVGAPETARDAVWEAEQEGEQQRCRQDVKGAQPIVEYNAIDLIETTQQNRIEVCQIKIELNRSLEKIDRIESTFED